jgi:hypothetical protein
MFFMEGSSIQYRQARGAVIRRTMGGTRGGGSSFRTTCHQFCLFGKIYEEREVRVSSYVRGVSSLSNLCHSYLTLSLSNHAMQLYIETNLKVLARVLR